MIGSNSWGSGELLSGRIALAVLLAALVSAAFLKGEPHRTDQETDAPVSTVFCLCAGRHACSLFLMGSMDVAQRQGNQPALKMK
ncbi:hypothetical protein DM992_17770 [Burkholderia sp. JP2-270]|uniref:hypothetical protein n=1 Tax=Burkholderia sp. JP2-270 TaxID=2217913 RepID=UPI000DA330A0|nr:hypothetical protein [Burkholderia sp. JP2-270]AWV01421.1 hypothetical protein DM992_17770 [Burkholderia sp. JP2-270]